MTADSEADSAGTVEVVAVVGSGWGFAALASVPRLPDRGSVVVPVNFQKVRETLRGREESQVETR